MDTETACVASSAITVGLAWVVTGAVSVGLPAGRRLEALLALVVGGGVGIVGLGLAVALGSDRESQDFWAIAYLLSSLAGALAVFLMLGALVTRDRRER